MRILVVGDSFLPLAVFTAVFRRLEDAHEIRYAALDESRPAHGTGVERVREYLGTPQELAQIVGDAEVLVVHGAPVTDEVLAAAPGLRLVGCARGGPVNVDLDAAARRGVPVALAPGKNAEAVADLTVGLMIMLARRIPAATRTLRENEGRFGSNFGGAEFTGRELGDATLGLVGFGNVGRQVHTRARGFGMRTLVHDPFVTVLDDGAEPVELDALLAASDFVSLHARASTEAHGLIGEAALARMKPGAFLINTARESLIDEDALRRALAEGRLAGAGLDVVEQVAKDARHPLLDDPRVIITPHVGGATEETLIRGARMMARAVACVAAGDEPPHLAQPVRPRGIIEA